MDESTEGEMTDRPSEHRGSHAATVAIVRDQRWVLYYLPVHDRLVWIDEGWSDERPSQGSSPGWDAREPDGDP